MKYRQLREDMPIGAAIQQALANADITTLLTLLDKTCSENDFRDITLTADQRLQLRVFRAAWRDASRATQQDEKANALLPVAKRKTIEKNLETVCHALDQRVAPIRLDDLQLIQAMQASLTSGEVLSAAEKMRVTKKLIHAMDERTCEHIRDYVPAERWSRVKLGQFTAVCYGIGDAASTGVSAFIVAAALFGNLPLAFVLGFLVVFPATCWANWTLLNSILPKRMGSGLGILQVIEPTTGEVQSLTGWDKVRAVFALTLTAIMALAFFAITAYSMLSIPIKLAAALGMTLTLHGAAVNTLTLVLMLATNPWGWLALAAIALFATAVGVGYFIIFGEIMVKNSRRRMPSLAQLWQKLRALAHGYDWKRGLGLALLLSVVAFGVVMTALFGSYALLGIFGATLAVTTLSWVVLVVASAVLLPSYLGAAYAAFNRYWPPAPMATHTPAAESRLQQIARGVAKVLFLPVKAFFSLLLVDRLIVRPVVSAYNYVTGRAWAQTAPRVTKTLETNYGLQADKVLQRSARNTFTLFDEHHARQFTRVQRTAQVTNACANGALPTPEAMRLVSAPVADIDTLDPVAQVLAGIDLTPVSTGFGVVTTVGGTCASVSIIATAEPVHEDPTVQAARCSEVEDTVVDTDNRALSAVTEPTLQNEASAQAVQRSEESETVSKVQRYQSAALGCCARFWHSPVVVPASTPAIEIERVACVY